MEAGFEINWLLVIVAIAAVWRMWSGFRTGLVNEINRFVSLVGALFVLALSVMIIYGFMEKNTKNIVTAVIVLLLTGLLFSLLNLVMKSIRTIVKLPIISFIDRVLGMGLGLAEVVVGCWIMYCCIQIFPLGGIGERILLWTNENEILMKLYASNWFLDVLS